MTFHICDWDLITDSSVLCLIKRAVQRNDVCSPTECLFELDTLQPRDFACLRIFQAGFLTPWWKLFLEYSTLLLFQCFIVRYFNAKLEGCACNVRLMYIKSVRPFRKPIIWSCFNTLHEHVSVFISAFTLGQLLLPGVFYAVPISVIS
jgi:hypothetical protein